MHLTVIPIDKQIYLETPDAQYPNRRCHVIDNDSEFWNSVDSRILAIQYHSDGLKQIEYKNPREDVVITDIATVQKYIKFTLFDSIQMMIQQFHFHHIRCNLTFFHYFYHLYLFVQNY